MKNHSEKFIKLVNEAKQEVSLCSIADIKHRIDSGEKLNLIDVREDSEWTAGHLPTARHIGKGIIERDVELMFPDTGTELVLYCGGGYRSALAGFNLKKMGYSNVVSVEGGYSAWKEAGHNIVKDKI